MERITVTIEKATHKRLSLMKINKEMKSLDEVINCLLDNGKKKSKGEKNENR